MSAQLIEILFLAGIAFLIISKFISILGTTDEDDPARKAGSFFGEPKGMKDVTNTVSAGADDTKVRSLLKIAKKLKKLDKEELEHLKAIFTIFPDFNMDKFLKGAKAAFGMVVSALHEKDLATIEELVDKRFIEQVKDMSAIYGKTPSKAMEASIVDSYSLGNSVYVKVLFKGSTSKVKSLKEEWVFTKNIQQSGPDWFLSNIER